MTYVDGFENKKGKVAQSGPSAKVGPCSFAVVDNGTGNVSLRVLSSMPEGTNERYQNTATPFQKCEFGNLILRTFLKIFAPCKNCYM